MCGDSTSFSNAQKAKKEHQQHLLKIAGLREESTIAARNIQDKHTKTTRRVLALLSAITLITGIVILAASGIPIAVETTRSEGGFLFFPERTITEFVTVEAIPILAEYKLILLSVFGLYFGNNHAR
jgi:hypothetical protein